jgi:hypothetical protein
MQNGLVSKHNAIDPQKPIYFCDRQGRDSGPVSPDYRKAKEHVSECEKPLKVKKVTPSFVQEYLNSLLEIEHPGTSNSS